MNNRIYWKAEEFKYKKRSPDWYWIFWAGTLLITFLIYHFWKDYIFSTLIFISAIVLTIATLKKPLIKTYSLDKKSIYLDDEQREIPFSEIQSYNIDPANMKILIRSKNKMERLIQIPFEAGQNISKIDKFLSTKIKKDPDLKIPFFELLLSSLLEL